MGGGHYGLEVACKITYLFVLISLKPITLHRIDSPFRYSSNGHCPCNVNIKLSEINKQRIDSFVLGLDQGNEKIDLLHHDSLSTINSINRPNWLLLFTSSYLTILFGSSTITLLSHSSHKFFMGI